jgi:hypothetical protein
MITICLIVTGIIFYASFLQAAESKFKFTFGSKIGGIPFELNKMSKDIKTLPGIKINSWILSPNYSSFAADKKLFNLLTIRQAYHLD